MKRFLFITALCLFTTFSLLAQQSDLERTIRYNPLTQQLTVNYYLTNNTGNGDLNMAEFHQELTYNTNVFTFNSWHIANRTWTETLTFTNNGVYRTVDLMATSGANCPMDHKLPPQTVSFSYLVASLVLDVPNECLLPHIGNNCANALDFNAINDPASPGYIGSTANTSPNFLGAPSSGSNFRLRERTGGCPGNINNTISYSPAWRLDPSAPIILPVGLKSFQVSRLRNQVSVSWSTLAERNNSGFFVQRSFDNKNFETLGFVASKAQGGNSDLPLNYSYADNLQVKGVVFYRLRQVDFDGNQRFSEIRIVKGEGGADMMVFPNPSSTGNVNLVFEDNVNGRDVKIFDANGRIVKQYNRVATSNLTVTNLEPGIYIVKADDPVTGTGSTQRLVVNRK